MLELVGDGLHRLLRFRLFHLVDGLLLLQVLESLLALLLLVALLLAVVAGDGLVAVPAVLLLALRVVRQFLVGVPDLRLQGLDSCLR